MKNIFGNKVFSHQSSHTTTAFVVSSDQLQAVQLFVAFSILLLAFSISSCKKLVQIDAPVTSTNSANVYQSDATAISALTGIYAKISIANFASSGGSLPSISLLAGLSSDELTLYSGVSSTSPYVYYYSNALTSASTTLSSPDFWTINYQLIFFCNAALEGLSQSSSLTPKIKQQLLGEAKFIRGFCYFYLVNLYGDVPLVTTTDLVTNETLGRSPKNLVYQQIISDLKDAQNLLSSNFLDATLLNKVSDRVRPSKWAATALLARVYLYNQDWIDAELQSDSILANSSTFSLSSLNQAFVKASAGNNEAIWQLQPVNSGYNTQDAIFFTIPTTGPNVSNPVFLSPYLLNSFEANDLRRTKWIDSTKVGSQFYYYPSKYKVAAINQPVTEYEMVLRLGEQLLIRAEARARQGNVIGAASDLNLIRTRAGLPGTQASNQSDMLSAIQHERQVELFTEWGHRWLDLKRTGQVDDVMSIVTPQKGGGTWVAYKQWYPILLSELQNDPNLLQNLGY